jgi:hypothetical protein
MAAAKKNSKHQGAGGGQGKHAPENRKPPQPKESGATVKEALAKANPLSQLKNSAYHNKRLDALKDSILAKDANGNFKISNKEFEKQVVNHVVAKLQDARAAGLMKGGLLRLPKSGKAFVIGDLHEQTPNLTAVLREAQLDKNPDTKLIFLGDILSGTKSGESSAVMSHDDSMHRIISWLQARYPDQIFVINGNHEMHIMGSVKGVDVPIEASYSAYLAPMEAMKYSDPEQVVKRVAESPLMIQIGDKSKGELTRTFQHSPGQDRKIDLEQVEGLDDVTSRYQRGIGIFDGEESLEEKHMQDLNKVNRSDLTYFGHVAPSTVARRLEDEDIVPVESKGLVMKVKGGGIYVDSQTMDSGIVEIDLDKDSAKEKMTTFTELHEKHRTINKGFGEYGGDDKDMLVK